MTNVILNNALGCLMNFMANYDDPTVPVGEKYTNCRNVQKYYSEKNSKPEVKDSAKTTTVKETKVVKSEESKPVSERKKEEVLTLPIPAQEKPKEEKAKSVPVQVKVKPSKSEKKEEQKITVQARKSCPIKILSKEEKEKVKATKREKLDILNDEGFHHLSHFIEYLRNAGIQYSQPVKMDTGLYEIVIYSNGRQLPISVDVDGLLYCDEIKFFIGQVRPGEEYVKHPIMLTKEVLKCLRNNTQIPAKYYIPDSLFNLNKVVDLQTLKEKDPKKREATF